MAPDYFVTLLNHEINNGPLTPFTFDLNVCFSRSLVESLHATVQGRSAPPLVRDLMEGIAVFGEKEKSFDVMTRLIDLTDNQSKWIQMLDLTNVKSDVKAVYGHCILQGNPNRATTLEDDPLARLIIEHGYLDAPRGDSYGILPSLLCFSTMENTPAWPDQPASVKRKREEQCLDLVLNAEARSPGIHINENARDAFSVSPIQEFVIRECIRVGVNLNAWISSNTMDDLAGQLSALQSSVDAKKAVDGVMAILRSPGVK